MFCGKILASYAEESIIEKKQTNIDLEPVMDFDSEESSLFAQQKTMGMDVLRTGFHLQIAASSTHSEIYRSLVCGSLG